jgi:hypothetical protein
VDTAASLNRHRNPRNAGNLGQVTMIHFLSHYRQRWQYERVYWLTRAEKRRAVLLTCGIMACVTITVLLWLMR